jgi:hypothetical protein
MTQAKADGGRTAHTPGPWQFCADHPQNACAYVKDADGLEIATVYGGGFDDGAPRAPNGIWGPQPSRDKVARLIAAAPDPLEALQNASGLLDTPLGRRRHADDSFYDAVVQSIRAALATAKIGGAS